MAGVPRVFFAAMPDAGVADAIEMPVRKHRLDVRLGPEFFARDNWHQSLSERIYRPTRDECASLLAVGEGIRTHACTLSFNRIDSRLTDKGRIQWTLRARGVPKAFEALQGAVREALRPSHPVMATGTTPHITLSYGAPEMLEKINLSPTIEWTLRELLLVVGGGSPYRYDIIGRWPLLPEIDPPQVQLGMF